MPSPRHRLASSCATLLLAGSLGVAASACASSAGANATNHGSSPSSTPSRGTTGKPTTSTTTTTTIPPVSPVGGKVTVLEIGDSLGIDLGWGLQWALAHDSSVNLVADAVGDTGLVNTAYYDWAAHLQSELSLTHPQIVIVFIGANDIQNYYDNGKFAGVGTALWSSGYGQRVGALMTEATAAGARMLWVGMPVMEDPSFSAHMQAIDAIYQSEAAKHPGVTYFSSWPLFTTSSGAYNAGTSSVSGQPLALRTPDGIHLASGGGDLLASALVTQMKSLYRLP